MEIKVIPSSEKIKSLSRCPHTSEQKLHGQPSMECNTTGYVIPFDILWRSAVRYTCMHLMYDRVWFCHARAGLRRSEISLFISMTRPNWPNDAGDAVDNTRVWCPAKKSTLAELLSQSNAAPSANANTRWPHSFRQLCNWNRVVFLFASSPWRRFIEWLQLKVTFVKLWHPASQ